MRHRPTWSPAPRLLAYLLAVVALAVALGVHAVASTPVTADDLFLWAVLAGCATFGLEATRHTGEPSGVSRDLLSVWTLPIALLLPPVYALLTPALLTTVKQLRVGRSPVQRRALSAAAIGLEGYGRAVVFQALAGGTLPAVELRGGGAVGLSLLAAVLIGFVFVQANAVLVAVAVRIDAPQLGWRQLLGQRAEAPLDLLELTLGAVIAAACLTSWYAAVLALPAMILLHRTLIHDQLRAAARTDAKTGLLNAATWQEEADREIARANRTDSPLTVVIADLDHFKRVNDRHGHLVGDRVLAAAARALQAGSRPYDLLGRFGGEEFAVLLPGTDVEEAARVTDRLRRLVAASTTAAGDSSVDVTVSIGASVLGRHGDDLTDLLVAADLALYRAKAAGRDTVVFAPSGTG